ncbi:MAG: CAP domain-containing protein [Hyphomonas sp.]
MSAQAAEGCSIAQGLSQDVDKFAEEAAVCLKGAPGIVPRNGVASELARLTDVARTGAGRDGLEELDSLNEAALIHAMDMAARGYAAHLDPEGRSHVDRVRLLDRTSLFGAFGANVTIVPANASPKDIELAILQDPSNADNVLRRQFNKVGVGAAEKDGKLYIVQIFAEQVGQLSKPLPARLKNDQVVKVRFADPELQRVGWTVTGSDGAALATGRSLRLSGLPQTEAVGYLTVDARAGGGVSTLKGPAFMVD